VPRAPGSRVTKSQETENQVVPIVHARQQNHPGATCRFVAGSARFAAVLGLVACTVAFAGAKDSRKQGSAPGLQIARQLPAVNANQPQADVVGGYVSGYLCLRLQPGVQPAQLADGSWTLRRAAAIDLNGAARNEAVELVVDEAAARDIFQRHHTTSIERFYRFEFKRPDLARKYGLDRSYLAHVNVAAGGDVRALLADLTAPQSGLGQLIEHAQLDNVGSIAAVPNDAFFTNQWDMHNTGQTVGGIAGVVDADIDAPEAWDIHTGSTSTIIAILDTGVQHATPHVPGSVDHPELAGKVIDGWNTRDETIDTTDPHGHGTHCAGIAAALGNNGIGVAGTNWNARVLAMRVTSSSGGAFQTDVAEGVIYAADNDADVISMSLQFYTSAVVQLENAVAYAYDSGVLPVAAAGNFPNQGMGHVAWPARYEKCMAIAGTTNTDARWFDSASNGSCDGPEVDVAAPAKQVYNLWRNSGYQSQIGTSMATPHVSGLAALLMSYNPALTVPQIESLLRSTAEDVNAGTNPGFDNFLGHGRINMRDALLAAIPDCEGDATGNGTIDADDLTAVILAWGPCPAPPAACPADVNPHPAGNGVVDADDLVAVVLRWGAACP
jgi:subtilisin family serine protease